MLCATNPLHRHKQKAPSASEVFHSLSAGPSIATAAVAAGVAAITDDVSRQMRPKQQQLVITEVSEDEDEPEEYANAVQSINSKEDATTVHDREDPGDAERREHSGTVDEHREGDDQ